MSKAMNVKETAAYLEISVDTIYRMARSGELPHFKIRSMYRFEKWAIEEWKRQQQMQSLEQAN